jgi:hypothetical protein
VLQLLLYILTGRMQVAGDDAGVMPGQPSGGSPAFAGQPDDEDGLRGEIDSQK